MLLLLLQSDLMHPFSHCILQVREQFLADHSKKLSSLLDFKLQFLSPNIKASLHLHVCSAIQQLFPNFNPLHFAIKCFNTFEISLSPVIKQFCPCSSNHSPFNNIIDPCLLAIIWFGYRVPSPHKSAQFSLVISDQVTETSPYFVLILCIFLDEEMDLVEGISLNSHCNFTKYTKYQFAS